MRQLVIEKGHVRNDLYVATAVSTLSPLRRFLFKSGKTVLYYNNKLIPMSRGNKAKAALVLVRGTSPSCVRVAFLAVVV